jgi:hypothetical protein
VTGAAGGDVAGGAVWDCGIVGGAVDGGDISTGAAVEDGIEGAADGETTNHVPSTPWPLVSADVVSPENR